MIYGTAVRGFEGVSFPLEKSLQIWEDIAKNAEMEAVELPNMEAEEELLLRFLQPFRITGVHLPFINLPSISQDPKVKKWREQIKLGIKKASELGIDYVVVHITDPAGQIDRNGWESYKKTVSEFLKYAEDFGVILTLENISYGFFKPLERLTKLVREIGSSRLGITLDTSHVSAIRDCVRVGCPEYADLDTERKVGYSEYGSLSSYIESEGGIIKNVHANDHSQKGRVLTGEGEVDLPGVIKALQRIDYRYSLIVEVGKHHRPEDHIKCIKRLRSYEIDRS